jgi:phage tail-like protein
VTDEPAAPTNGDSAGLFHTFVGSGFGTVQIERAVGADPPPQSVSGRGDLRANLPSIYSDGDFGMRLVTGLELVLDPLVAALDNLPEHFDPVYAPRDVLDLLTAWFGLEHDEARSGEERREIVRMAPELMRRRGTKAGLELAVNLAFPGVPFRIEDGGAVTWSLDLDDIEPADAPAFVVYCDVPLSSARLGAVARLIEQAKPAHVSYRLRVRAAQRDTGNST